MGSRQPGALSSTLAVALAGWLAAGPVWAGAVPAQTRPDLAVLIVPLGPQVEAAAGRIDFAARDAVKKAERFDLVRLVDVLDGENARARESRVEVGETALQNARNAYNELDTIKALEETKKAIAAFEETDLTRRMSGLTGAWIMKIASLVANGETKAAQLEIQKLVAVAPDASFSPNYFPPDEIAFAERARAQAKKGTSTLEVKTTPTGAEVYVDGTFRGISPLTVTGLAPGDHYVTAKAPGHSLVQQKARPGDVSLTLPRAESAPRYEQVLERVVRDPYGPGRDEAAKEFGAWLGVDQLFLGILEASPGASEGQLTFVRLDVKDGHNYAWVHEQVSLNEGLVKEAEALATRMLVADDARRGGPVTHYLDRGDSFFTRKNTGYILLGTGVALLASGVVFGLQASSQSQTFRGLPQTDARAEAARSSGQTWALMADLSLLAGLAAAGTGGYLAFFPTGEKKVGPSPAPKKDPLPAKAEEPAPKKEEERRKRLDEDDLRNW